MGKAQKQRIQRLVWYRLAAGVLGTAIVGLTALGPSSWRFLAAAIGLFPLLLLLSWGYEREKRREEAHGTPRERLGDEWRPRPEDGRR